MQNDIRHFKDSSYRSTKFKPSWNKYRVDKKKIIAEILNVQQNYSSKRQDDVINYETFTLLLCKCDNLLI